jgi:hypothetical protein
MVHDDNFMNNTESIEEQLALEKHRNELWRMKYNQLSACITKLCDHLLGKNYVIVDSVDETTACEIITEDIMKHYKDVNKNIFGRLKK